MLLAMQLVCFNYLTGMLECDPRNVIEPVGSSALVGNVWKLDWRLLVQERTAVIKSRATWLNDGDDGVHR